MAHERDSLDTHFDLERLIHPVEVKRFINEHWEQKPLYIERQEPAYYADLLTLDDVDRLLTLSGPSFDTIRVVVDGHETPISEIAKRGTLGRTNTLEAIYDHYRQGSTVVLNALDDRWEPLRQLVQVLGAEVSAGFQVNVYLTPAGKAQGFKPHYDTHDVLIAQVHGSKQWRLYGAPYELPLADRPKFGKKFEGDETPEQQLTLRAGDFLYLPRGAVHAASSNDEASIHLTIGVHQAHWATVLQNAMVELFDQDVRFRRALPAGFARDADLQRTAAETLGGLLAALQEKLSPTQIIDSVVAQAMSVNAPNLAGHLRDLEDLRDLAPESVLRRRKDVLCHVVRDESTVKVHFHNKTIELPVQVAEQVEWLVAEERTSFRPSEIPGRLDLPGRLVLAQTFLREGLLTC
ncbi:cupin domain-containing protein [Streptomyces sp. NBC_00078]|uniref:cupin domain-containing protein n=1 Tax=unclassified Streptomyces TaxID=2593676 RepID=UPI0022577429|nr:cupin domain-containing protein [Streptomyces sp. NBC_00078]MCX5421458.1 cupin domain-containing protein [Streptomyces sp. NBC_00078]